MGIGSGELVEHLEGEERGEASSGAGADEEDRAHGSTAQDANRPYLVQIQHHLLIHLNLDRPTYALLDAGNVFDCLPQWSLFPHLTRLLFFSKQLKLLVFPGCLVAYIWWWKRGVGENDSFRIRVQAIKMRNSGKKIQFSSFTFRI